MSSTQLDAKVENTRELSRLLANVLTWGFRIGATVIGLGIVLAVIQHRELAESIGSPSQLLKSIRSGNANGIISVGLLVIVLSPMAGVIALLRSFWLQGDRRYAQVSLLLLTIMIACAALQLGG
ncbi:MAG: DUF1634 domain-containing protein [Thermomicrobiales bacterium]|nr:DUF1634 domain-containing protein [Thermomicrobiales bacterium]